MTVQRCLDHFKKEFAWAYKVANTFSNTRGYDKYKFISSCRHAYRMVNIYNRDLSIRQLKNLYLRIRFWLEEIVDLYA